MIYLLLLCTLVDRCTTEIYIENGLQVCVSDYDLNGRNDQNRHKKDQQDVLYEVVLLSISYQGNNICNLSILIRYELNLRANSPLLAITQHSTSQQTK